MRQVRPVRQARQARQARPVRPVIPVRQVRQFRQLRHIGQQILSAEKHIKGTLIKFEIRVKCNCNYTVLQFI